MYAHVLPVVLLCKETSMPSETYGNLYQHLTRRRKTGPFLTYHHHNAAIIAVINTVYLVYLDDHIHVTHVA